MYAAAINQQRCVQLGVVRNPSLILDVVLCRQQVK